MERLPPNSPNNNDDPFAQLEQDEQFKAAYGEFDEKAAESEHPQLASYDQPEGAVLRLQTEEEDGSSKELTFVRTRYEKDTPQLGWSLREQIPGSDDFTEIPVNLAGQDPLLDNHDGPRKGNQAVFVETEEHIVKSGYEFDEDSEWAYLPPIKSLTEGQLKDQFAAKSIITLPDGSVAWRIAKPIKTHVSGKITGASVELPNGTAPTETETPTEEIAEDQESPEEQAERARVTPEVEEILSNYQFLKSDIRKGAVDVQNVFTKAWAAARNLASTPGKIRRDAERGLAEMRHGIAEKKTDKAKQKYEEAAAMQDQSNSKLVNFYRDRKAARRYTKYMERVKKQAHRNSILTEKTSAYDSHDAMMKARTAGVDVTKGERHRSIDQHRHVLMEQRIAAESRKLERQKRRAQRIELLNNRKDLSHEQREALANQLSPEARKEIREKAIAAIKARNIRTRTMINY